ncbi:hypothetical protein PPL_00742 [Heterostelium album PN500]|uniref:Uncharacterized protein n=1 Tax=Heterostelium pallidum (strain ATCC 26659 / Pp 5 / PN500) TaxID=670386 RepID=D3AXB1_HETP5|nr:hypothetical protein PPL_00742 [Heterostelium album PN500]EFA86180.1 hypothetical protein PPL_00742 [Heterostelium album PN500]|eukprot:XP_020438285.1 hypothetical protein PPL_00742 [Heterostelium album PN500]
MNEKIRESYLLSHHHKNYHHMPIDRLFIGIDNRILQTVKVLVLSVGDVGDDDDLKSVIVTVGFENVWSDFVMNE